MLSLFEAVKRGAGHPARGVQRYLGATLTAMHAGGTQVSAMCTGHPYGLCLFVEFALQIGISLLKSSSRQWQACVVDADTLALRLKLGLGCPAPRQQAALRNGKHDCTSGTQSQIICCLACRLLSRRWSSRSSPRRQLRRPYWQSCTLLRPPSPPPPPPHPAPSPLAPPHALLNKLRCQQLRTLSSVQQLPPTARPCSKAARMPRVCPQTCGRGPARLLPLLHSLRPPVSSLNRRMHPGRPCGPAQHPPRLSLCAWRRPSASTCPCCTPRPGILTEALLRRLAMHFHMPMVPCSRRPASHTRHTQQQQQLLFHCPGHRMVVSWG